MRPGHSSARQRIVGDSWSVWLGFRVVSVMCRAIAGPAPSRSPDRGRAKEPTFQRTAAGLAGAAYLCHGGRAPSHDECAFRRPLLRRHGYRTGTGAGLHGITLGTIACVVSSGRGGLFGFAFVPPKYGVRRLGPARVVVDTPVGGGWGDPLTRPPERVLRDVRDGVVSTAAVARDYGVVIAPDGCSVDVEATAERRG